MAEAAADVATPVFPANPVPPAAAMSSGKLSPSALHVLELYQLAGRPYACGELNQTARGKCFTGSEISAFCNESRFKSPRDAFWDKILGIRYPDSEGTLHGKKYEPVALQKFAERTGATLYFVGFIRHPHYEWLGGHFDALAIMPDGRGVLVEVKCPIKRAITHFLPEHYKGQVQMYMEIAGLETCMFVQYKPEYETPKKKLKRPEKLDILEVQREHRYIALALPVLWKEWKEVCMWRVTHVPLMVPAMRLIKTACTYIRARRGDMYGKEPGTWKSVVDLAREFRKLRIPTQANGELEKDRLAASPLQEPIVPIPADKIIVQMSPRFISQAFRQGIPNPDARKLQHKRRLEAEEDRDTDGEMDKLSQREKRARLLVVQIQQPQQNCLPDTL